MFDCTQFTRIYDDDVDDNNKQQNNKSWFTRGSHFVYKIAQLVIADLMSLLLPFSFLSRYVYICTANMCVCYTYFASIRLGNKEQFGWQREKFSKLFLKTGIKNQRTKYIEKLLNFWNKGNKIVVNFRCCCFIFLHTLFSFVLQW